MDSHNDHGIPVERFGRTVIVLPFADADEESAWAAATAHLEAKTRQEPATPTIPANFV